MKINIVTSGVVFNAVKNKLSENDFLLARWNKGEPEVKVIAQKDVKIIFNADNNYFWNHWGQFLNEKDEDNQWNINKKFIDLQSLLEMTEDDQYYFGFFWNDKNILFLFNLESENALRFKVVRR